MTLPLHKNYGGILQVAALYEYMTASGVEVVLLERGVRKSWKNAAAKFLARLPLDIIVGAGSRLVRNEKLYALQNFISNHRFIWKFLPRRSGPLLDSADMRHAIDRLGLDMIIVGSDQVWRQDYLPPDALPDYFLGFAEGTRARRVSYAASFGHGGWRYPELTAEVSTLLSRFSAVSVREASGVDICRDVLGRGDAVHVLDPTLVVDPAFYERVADAPTTKTGKVLFEYILDHDGEAPTIGEDVADSLWTEYSVCSVALEEGGALPGIGGWVRAIMDADFIMTDSFHGMVFSIIFQKDFVALVNHKRGADRFTSLAGLLGLEDRLLAGSSRSQAREIAARPIDYSAVSARLKLLRERSCDFLRDALAGGEA
ncbi:polysaccharide pyruvyl transferase family protein [Phenylobacterium sp.]|uniref:polysaccharide pyruvyl transferase family protein n=1 Tax=Phenylobacterium sp. TaxID=1871053 RepID=UPI002627ABFE|nr:polysaccharide pyruvyl transferase family protein [Phenylobacterium sp.]